MDKISEAPSRIACLLKNEYPPPYIFSYKLLFYSILFYFLFLLYTYKISNIRVNEIGYYDQARRLAKSGKMNELMDLKWMNKYF